MPNTAPAIIALVCLIAGIAFAQTPELRFETASVKPAAKQEGSSVHSTIDRPPGRYRATNMPLRRLLANAFALKDYQLQTPGWMDDARYDISAKASGTPGKQAIDVMVQNLLVERFKMEIHREQKEMPVYWLRVAKSGCKLKETTIAPGPPVPASEPPAPPSSTSIRSMMSAPDAAGFPVLNKPGAITRGDGDRTKMTAAAFSIEQLINMLSMLLQRDVIDETGLTGKYDFHLEYSNDTSVASTVPVPAMLNRTVSDPSGPSIFSALQDQLGLRLESGKTPRPLLVVDRAEKTPIAN